MKLIFRKNWGNESESGIIIIPFEYFSKEDFCLSVLEKIEQHKKERNIKLFEDYTHYGDMSELEQIEEFVYTLDEWFEKYKEKTIE